MAPDYFSRINGPAAIHTVRIHVHDLFARHGQCVSVNKQNVASPVVARRELADEGFGLASVGRLKRAKSFLAGNSAIKEERSPIRHFDFAKLSPRGTEIRLGTVFE